MRSGAASSAAACAVVALLLVVSTSAAVQTSGKRNTGAGIAAASRHEAIPVTDERATSAAFFMVSWVRCPPHLQQIPAGALPSSYSPPPPPPPPHLSYAGAPNSAFNLFFSRLRSLIEGSLLLLAPGRCRPYYPLRTRFFTQDMCTISMSCWLGGAKEMKLLR